MRKRDPELGSYIGTNCPQVDMLTNGKTGGKIAGDARKQLELKSGKQVVSKENYLPEKKENKKLK